MAFSREPMLGSTAKSRQRKTSYTDPYAAAAAARSTQRSTPQRYANPFTGQLANQPPQDPLVSAIAGGSTGGGFDDTVTPTGINTDAPGVFQEQTQGKTASGGAVPFNQPPPPPPPPPMSAGDYSALSSGGVTPPAPSQTRVLPQGGLSDTAYRQAMELNSNITGVQPQMSASDYFSMTGSGNRPASQPFDDTVTPTGISTEVSVVTPRDLPTVVNPYASGTSTPNNTFDDTVTPTGRSTEVSVVAPRDLPAPFNPYASGTSTPTAETTPTPFNPYASGTSTPEVETSRPTVFNPYASGTSTPNNTFDDTVTPTGISTEVATSTPRDLPSMAEAQASQIRQPSMTADDYRNILRGEIAGIGSGAMTADEYGRLSSGMEDRLTQAIGGQMTADDYNRMLSGESNRIIEATTAGRMSPEDYQSMLRGETQGIRDSIMTADDYQNILRGETQGIRDAIVTADDYNRLLSGQGDRIVEAVNQGRMTADDYRNVLRGELTARDEQARQAEIAAEQERQRQQAGLDMQRAQSAQAMNDRTRELLQGYTGGTPAQRDMMMAQAPTFQQQELLRRAESRLQAPSGATDAQAAMFAAQRPTELPDVSGFRSSYADAAAAQGGGGATPTGYTNPYADAAAQQPDTGLRTFSSQPRFSPMTQGVDRPSDTLQQRLEQEYLGRISAADDPILASQIADQQLRQQEAEKGLIEQLSRYGVLRGGGDTAATLTRLTEGNERNRLALEAAAAQRRQGDLRDALTFDQARAQMGLAERGQTLQERRGQEDILGQQLSRQLQQAGVTGQFQGQDTLQAQQQRQQMDLAERGTALQEQLGGETILDRQQGRDIAAAGLTGRFGDADTLSGRELSLREDLSRRGDLRAQQAAESELFGRVITGTDAPITTIQGQRAASDLDTAGLAREATEAGLTGQFRGGATATERALESQLESQDLARQLQEAGVTGQYGGENTLQSQVIESSLQNEALNRGLSRAGATGVFREEGDTGTGTETLESRLRTAGLTGELDNQLTLGGRQAEQDLIGSILAASDPEFKGRNDALAMALTGRLGAEEQQRMQASFLDEFKALGDDAGYDEFFQLAERYGNVPVVAEALEEILSQGDPQAVRERLKGMSSEQAFEYLKRLKEQGYDPSLD